ncbi:MAG TPA: menaquinol-cytochrome C reductase [Bacillota bacterium]
MARPAEKLQPEPKDSSGRPNPLERLYTWPHFLIIEFVTYMTFIVLLFLTSILIKAPLLGQAQPTYTPNPAKAPWYFLNLQELLLHMNPSLAGVIVPGIVITLIAAIPYIDKDERGVGVWFTSRKGVEIFRFSFIYTTIWIIALVLFDEFIGTKPLLEGLGLSTDLVEIIGGIIIPVLVMVFINVLLVALVKRRWQADTRHTIIALFTVFVASYFVLTIIGSAFRGESMRLVWPWEIQHPH